MYRRLIVKLLDISTSSISLIGKCAFQLKKENCIPLNDAKISKLSVFIYFYEPYKVNDSYLLGTQF